MTRNPDKGLISIKSELFFTHHPSFLNQQNQKNQISYFLITKSYNKKDSSIGIAIRDNKVEVTTTLATLSGSLSNFNASK